MRILFGIVAATLLSCICSAASADPLKIASWNVANLASGPGVPLRGHERTVADYQHIRDIIAKLSPDVIALQEVGSFPAARAILGGEYTIIFEERCLKNAAHCEADVDDIFTAIAYRTSLGTLKPIQVPQLAIEHRGICPADAPRPVRGGVGVELSHEGTEYIVLSVHLKASCKNNDAESRPDQTGDCETSRRQFAILADWINAERIAGREVIIAGDFNREFEENGDHQGAFLRGAIPGVAFATFERSCWKDFHFPNGEVVRAAEQTFPEIGTVGGSPLPFRPSSNAKIDHFLTTAGAAGHVSGAAQYPMGPEARISKPATDYVRTCDGKPDKFENGKVLVFSEVEPSDHCPISMLLR